MNCGACGSDNVRQFIDFGKLPLGNAFLRQTDFQHEKRFRLELGYCHACNLVQQLSPPPVEALRSDYRNYAYVPFGKTLRDHYYEMAKDVVSTVKLGQGSFVVDIGSNNGMLLQFLRNITGCRVLGIEPAERISQAARDADVPTLTAFFDDGTTAKLCNEYGLADLVLCTQVLQHIPDVGHFVANVRRVLKPDGTFMVEGRYFGETVRKRSFDTVYHEMLWFFTMSSLGSLLEALYLRPYKAKTTPVYGGSLRVYAAKHPGPPPPPQRQASDDGLSQLSAMEAPLRKFRTYEEFARDVASTRDRLRTMVKGIKLVKGVTVAGYGAPSTSATLLNYCGIGREELSYIVDDSELKQGLFTPGTHVPIVPPSRLAEDPPDFLLILAWRLQGEILGKPEVKALRSKGMKVILPLPVPSII